MINDNSQELFACSLINSTDDSERTVIHWACSGGRTNIVAWLLNEGVQPDICDSRYVNDDHIKKYVLVFSSCLILIIQDHHSTHFSLVVKLLKKNREWTVCP